MNVEIEPFSALPCKLKVFKINGIDAHMDDFGDSEDTDIEHAADYGCGCHEMQCSGIRLRKKSSGRSKSNLWAYCTSEAAVVVSD